VKSACIVLLMSIWAEFRELGAIVEVPSDLGMAGNAFPGELMPAFSTSDWVYHV